MNCKMEEDWRKRVAGDWCKNCVKYLDPNDCDMWYNVMSGH